MLKGVFYFPPRLPVGVPYDGAVEQRVATALDASRHLVTCDRRDIPSERIIDFEMVRAQARRALAERGA